MFYICKQLSSRSCLPASQRAAFRSLFSRRTITPEINLKQVDEKEGRAVSTQAVARSDDRITTRANCFHGLTAALGVHLLQNSMNVVPHREFGQIKVRCDFLICLTLGHESD